jgi:hypothetical protein
MLVQMPGRIERPEFLASIKQTLQQTDCCFVLASMKPVDLRSTQ